ncbi:TenA family protein [Lichenicola sp.]|uniref:TenA family protein n=1 Tax=Lichenicola sp. TaxID=2804529 RepID=UPI003B005884
MAFDFDQAMPFARNTLYARLRAGTGAEWGAYVGHRFVQELALGTLPQDEFVAWMVQDYLYLVHYTRAYALLIYKSDTVAQMRAAATIVFGLLTDEMALHRLQLAASGISESDLEQIPETVETLAYGRYILDRAQSGDVLDLVVTLSACLAGYGEIGLRLLSDPQTVLEGNPYAAWIETYGGAAYHRLIRNGLEQLESLSESHGGETRYPLLLRQFRQAVRLETLFWDAGRTSLATSS